MKTKAETSLQRLAILLHKKFARSDDSWGYEVERVQIGSTTTTIRGESKVDVVMSTYSDDYDNIHDWAAFSHQHYLKAAGELLAEIKRLGLS